MVKTHKITAIFVAAALLLSLVVLFPVVTSADDPEPADVCSDLDGVQEAVPDGYQQNDDGTCTPISQDEQTDVCPNIDGDQAEVPDGYQLNESGDCVVSDNEPGDETPPGGDNNDVCGNLEGVQETIPEGYVADPENPGSCIQEQAEETDICPNLEGNQAEVPEGYQVDEEGNCTQTDEDQDQQDNNNNDDGKVLAATDTKDDDGGKVLAETLPDTGIAGSIGRTLPTVGLSLILAGLIIRLFLYKYLKGYKERMITEMRSLIKARLVEQGKGTTWI